MENLFKPSSVEFVNYKPDMDIVSCLMTSGVSLVFSVYNYLEALTSNGFIPYHGSYYLKVDDKILFVTLNTPYTGRTDRTYVHSKIFLKNDDYTLNLMKERKSLYRNDLQLGFRPEFYYESNFPTKEFFYLTDNLRLQSYEGLYCLNDNIQFKYEYKPFTDYAVEKISIRDTNQVKLNQVVFRDSKLASIDLLLEYGSKQTYLSINLKSDLYCDLFDKDLNVGNIVHFWNNSQDIKDVVEMEYFNYSNN